MIISLVMPIYSEGRVISEYFRPSSVIQQRFQHDFTAMNAIDLKIACQLVIASSFGKLSE